MEKKDKIHNSLNNLDADSQAEGEPEVAAPEPSEGGSVEELQKSLSEKTEEAQNLQNKYLRLAAEFENFKKLALRDQREHVRFANERLLKDLLPLLDNLERAIHSGKNNPAGDALLQGVELTLKQALESLAKFGLQPMDSLGQPFNPEWHQAVTKVETAAVPEHSVVDEFQRGYFLHERVLRPAMVSVASAKSEESSPETGSESDETPR